MSIASHQNKFEFIASIIWSSTSLEPAVAFVARLVKTELRAHLLPILRTFYTPIQQYHGVKNVDCITSKQV